ncbi:MAG TPA: DUF58 domain-containing protein [Actinomycetota bacterium]|nr:DUF58 domain-containing protein [Actinomycetota bacterium]
MASAPKSRMGGASGVRSGFFAAIERRAGITISGLVLLVLAVVGWIFAYFIGGRAMFLLVYGLAMVFVIAIIAGRRRLSVDAERSDLPMRVREGQLVDVEITLRAKRRLSTVILEEILHPQLGTSVRVPIPSLPSGQEVKHVYSFSPKLRGVYKVGPLTATWSDPFGLTRRRIDLNEPAEIIVHPLTEMVHDRVSTREWEDPPIRPPFSKPWPTGFEFYGMRDYVPGDDPRRIVWRASARTIDPLTGQGKYLIRESEQGITDRVSIILDTDIKYHSPGDPSDTFETAIKTCASLGAKHLRDGFGVTVETNEGRLSDQLRGQRDRLKLLDNLARIQPSKVTLSKLLERLMFDARRDLHNVVITPHVDQEAASRLRLLMDKGTSLVMAILLWEDTDPEAAHRAASLGALVVEIAPGVPLEAAFRRLAGAGVRRER